MSNNETRRKNIKPNENRADKKEKKASRDV